MPDQTFAIRGQTYRIEAQRLSALDMRIVLLDVGGRELAGLNLYEVASDIILKSGVSKELMSPEEMSVAVENDQYRLGVIFQNINLYEDDDGDMVADYGFYVLVGIAE